MPRVIDAEIVLPYLGGGGKIKSISENGVELPIDEHGNVDVPVPTKVSELENDEQFVKDSDLAGVAKSGDYNDLENTPAIPVVPTNVSDFNNDAGYVTKDVDNLSNYTKTEDLGDAALSNDYNDLDNLPTIPSLTGYATESYVNNAIGTHDSAVDAHTDIRTAIGNVDNKISSAADASNPAMDKNFINSSINNATATFQGSYNIVNDLNLSVSATHAQVATALDNTITGANKNDYCNVEIPSTSYSIFDGYDQFTSVDDYVEKYVLYNSVYIYVTDSNKNSLNITPGTTEAYLNNFLRVDRYKYVEVEGGTDYWDFDHTYNNSGFTADQWGSINSKATEAKINQIGTNTNDITNIKGDLYQNFPYIGTSTNWGTSASNCYLRTNYFQGGVVPQKEGDLVYSTGTRNFHRCGPLVWDSGQNCYKTNPVFILHVGEDNVQADWSQSNSSADDFIKNKPTLKTVATSGDYNDLLNKLVYSKTELTLQTTTLGAAQVDFDWDIAPILSAIYPVTISVGGVSSTLQVRAIAGTGDLIMLDYPGNGYFQYDPASGFNGHNGRYTGNATVESVVISGEVIYPLNEKYMPDKVSKSGDTMTGNLTILNSKVLWLCSNGGLRKWGLYNLSAQTLSIVRTGNDGIGITERQKFTSNDVIFFRYIYGNNNATEANRCLTHSEIDNPETSSSVTLVGGITHLNELGTIDYSTIALPATPGTAEYNGTFTSSTSGDITVSLPLTYWQGDTDIVSGKTYSFSIQNGVGFIIQLD